MSVINGNRDLLKEFTEPEWNLLLSYISSRRNVIPIIGEKLIKVNDPDTGEEMTLNKWLALKVFEDFLGVPADENADGLPGLTLNDAYCVAKEKGMEDVIYSKVKSLVEQAVFPPNESLRQLAEITDFRLFVTTTFDDQLSKALGEKRGQQVDVRRYEPNQQQISGSGASSVDGSFVSNGELDLTSDLQRIETPTVFHLLGKPVSHAPGEFVLSEYDMLRWISGLQDEHERPRHLCEELKSNHLLLLGCGYSDWLLRFFLRTLKKSNLETKDNTEYLVDDEIVRDPGLINFVRKICAKTIICNPDQSTEEFIADLSIRWHSQNSKVSEINRAIEETDSAFPPGYTWPLNSIFVSYFRGNRDLADSICGQLRDAGVPVWYDEAIGAGGRFNEEIEHRIEKCRFFIPIISGEMLKRSEGYFWREWNAACERSKGMSKNRTFIIPILVGDVMENHTEIPAKFQKANMIRAVEGRLGEKRVEEIYNLFFPGENQTVALSDQL